MRCAKRAIAMTRIGNVGLVEYKRLRKVVPRILFRDTVGR